MTRRAAGLTTALDETAAVAASGLTGDVYLVVADGTVFQAFALVVGHAIILGRAEQSDIVIQDAKASREHARVERHADGRLVLTDLGSRNGTKVRSLLVRDDAIDLDAGTIIEIGRTKLTVVCAFTPATPEEKKKSKAVTVEIVAPLLPSGFVMADPAMLALFRTAERFAKVDTPVLIIGETGVGKEVVAGQIHALGSRSAGPFVTLNCAALPDTIIESELFGHEKGAFTGATRKKIGFLEAADKGTLLLDELGDMPLTTQVKLLRFLETKKLTRLGSTAEIDVDVRIVAATHRDLPSAIRAGRFREDLYYRLSACTLKIPALRERPTEIASLGALFASQTAKKLGRASPPTLDPHLLITLQRYPWPGNIRELRNAIEHAVVMTDDNILRADTLPSNISASRQVPADPAQGLPTVLADVERDRIADALEKENHNQTRAAARLGISRRALLYKMSKYGITRPTGER